MILYHRLMRTGDVKHYISEVLFCELLAELTWQHLCLFNHLCRFVFSSLIICYCASLAVFLNSLHSSLDFIYMCIVFWWIIVLKCAVQDGEIDIPA